MATRRHKKAVTPERVKRIARTLEILATDWAGEGGPEHLDEAMYWLFDRASYYINERLDVLPDE